MSYITRLDRAFADAPVLPVGPDARYVFFSDCHRGIGNNNDNFLKNMTICSRNGRSRAPAGEQAGGTRSTCACFRRK